MRPVRTKTARRSGAVTVLASLTVLAACAGENLFTLQAVLSGLGPTVDITAPADAFVVALGDSLLVEADLAATAGLSRVQVRTPHAVGGAPAFDEIDDPLGSAATFALSAWLQAADGQVAGSAYIVVEVTDIDGAMTKDSVKVDIS